jgi:NDP-sugar pyrophosphorylase family protein
MNKNSIIVTNTKIEPSKNVQDSIIVTNKKLSFKILVPNRVLEDNTTCLLDFLFLCRRLNVRKFSRMKNSLSAMIP